MLNTGGGLWATYYEDQWLKRSKSVSVDGAISYFPNSTSSVTDQSTYASVRWGGYIRAPVSGTYTFNVVSADFARLRIGAREVAQIWGDSIRTSETSAGVNLKEARGTAKVSLLQHILSVAFFLA